MDGKVWNDLLKEAFNFTQKEKDDMQKQAERYNNGSNIDKEMDQMHGGGNQDQRAQKNPKKKKKKSAK